MKRWNWWWIIAIASGNVWTAAQLRTPLLLKNREAQWSDCKGIRELAVHGREKDTQYCETLYRYLTCCRSPKKLWRPFRPRNTVLYRIRRIQDGFHIPLDDPVVHADLLLGVSLLLFEEKNPDFFLHTINNSYCSEHTSKMLRISSVWHIHQIKFQKQLKKCKHFTAILWNFAWLWTITNNK